MLATMKDQRDLAILDVLRETRAATVAALADATGSSIATIRRDLQRLDDAGLLRRTHGGAVLVDADAPFATVVPINRESKERIGRAAAAEIHDGQSVILDIGTTTLQIARMLAGRRVSVITPNLAIYDVLRDDRSVTLVLLPGEYDPVYRSVSGDLTREFLTMVRADHAFVGVSGISASGDLRDTTIDQIPIKRAMAAASDAVTVVADHSKFPGTGTGLLTLPASVTRVVTDAAPPADTAQSLAARNVEVVVV